MDLLQRRRHLIARVVIGLLLLVATVPAVANGQQSANPTVDRSLSPKLLAEKAGTSIRIGFPEDAIPLLETCLSKSPRDKKCKNLLVEARSLSERKLLPRLNSADAKTLLQRAEILEQLERAAPGKYSLDLGTLRSRIADLQARSTAAINALHAGNFDAAADLLRQEGDTDVLAPLQREWAIHFAIQQAREKARAGDYSAAINAIRDNPETADALRSIRREVFDSLGARLAASINDDDLPALESVATSLDNASEILEPGELQTLRERIGIFLNAKFSSVAAVKGIPISGYTRRYLLAVLLGRLPQLARMSRTLESGADYTIRVNGPCGSDADQIGVVAAFRDALRGLGVPPENFNVELVNWECSAGEQEETGSAAVPSSYVQSHQQTTNPAYIQLLAQLDEARRAFASTEAEVARQNQSGTGGGFLSGFAQGMAIGLARNKVQALVQQLAETPPFLSTPIVAPYSAQRITLRKKSSVAITAKLTDSRMSQTQMEELRAFDEQTGESIRGVMPEDRAGLRNAETHLGSDAELIDGAFEKLTSEIHDAAYRLAGQMSLTRAGALAASRASTAEVLGSLLFALDGLGADAPELFPIKAVLDQALSIPFDKLATAKLDFASLLPKTVAPGGPSVAKTRVGMLEGIVDSVVTIETEHGTGSGFFVDSTGLILTNAHVLEGSSRIRVKTRAQEVFVGRVVQTSAARDLALLRISTTGVYPLSLGTVGDAVVGTDVIAVGSPLGLQGTVTKGIVSAIRKMNGLTVLQVDAPINPGNSGGPLVSEGGVVLGINTAKLVGESTEGLGFAVSVDEARRAFGTLLPPPLK